ncbi:hypothetical protein V5O48_004848 [Marasmius crinis-equi]|uniref:GST N-terminal domain-containing protein n=1 Tax=Marasmius crinis-equi TaxID=585013 RepID=A0ABR3FP18_9AGAR
MSNPQIELYDLASRLGGATWSPNVWKTRYILNYKGIPYKHVLLELPEVESVCKDIGASPTETKPDGSPFYTVPVIRDLSTGRVISDSLAIAKYLDSQYPSTPRVIPDAPGTLSLLASFSAAVSSKQGNAFPLLLPKIPQVLNPPSADHFTRVREGQLGVSLADVYPKDPEAQWKKVEADLAGVAGWFKEEKGEFLGGESPVYVDFELAAFLVIFRVILGEQSEDWKTLASFQDGKWGKFIESLKKWE